MESKLQELFEDFTKKLAEAKTHHQLMMIKSQFTGKKSKLSALLSSINTLAKEQRPSFGKQLNITKGKIIAHITEKLEKLKQETFAGSDSSFDPTMPPRCGFVGAHHPITQVCREIEDIFISMGFDISSYYEVEDEYHNFDALNTPQNHSSRDKTDTFYTTGGNLLRTQTSTEQIRVMENFSPPIKIISLGRCYRNDKQDASHSIIFNQVEALVVDKNITFADLKDTMHIFVEKMFGKSLKSRFRPHFFPFTEPSGEFDISCVNCGGVGCKTCKKSGWLEVAGCGMVDPNVFDELGIDNEKFTGFAFGFGIERLTMLKFGIPDIRLLFENDIRFLRQFR